MGEYSFDRFKRLGSELEEACVRSGEECFLGTAANNKITVFSFQLTTHSLQLPPAFYFLVTLTQNSLYKKNSRAPTPPWLQRINGRKIVPLQQLDEDFIQLDRCHILTRTLVPAVAEDEFIITLHGELLFGEMTVTTTATAVE